MSMLLFNSPLVFIYSAVSSPLKALYTCPLADLLIPTPIQLLREVFSNVVITSRRLHTHISTAVCSQVLIYTTGCIGASWRERKCPSFNIVANWIRTRALSIGSPLSYIVYICVVAIPVWCAGYNKYEKPPTRSRVGGYILCRN